MSQLVMIRPYHTFAEKRDRNLHNTDCWWRTVGFYVSVMADGYFLSRKFGLITK